MFQFVFTLFYKAVKGLVGSTFAVTRWTYRLVSSKRLSKRISTENAAARGIEIQERLNLDQLSWIPPRGKTIIAGDQPNSLFRNAVAARVAQNARDAGHPVLILHQGNTDLVNRLQAVFGDSLAAIGPGNEGYDLLRDYSVHDMIDILTMNGVATATDWIPACVTYLEGLLLVSTQIVRKGAPLYGLRALSGMNLAQLLDHVDAQAAAGRISASQASHIRSCLEMGAAGQHAVRRHLEQALTQLQRVALNNASLADEAVWNVGRLIRRGGAMSLDVSSVTEQATGYGLLLNELNKAIARGAAPYIIFSDLPLRANDALTRFTGYLSSSQGLCISCNDLLAQTGGNAEVFTALAGNSVCRVLFKIASGAAAQKWSEELGQYEKIMTTTYRNTGKSRGSPIDIFSGTNTGSGSGHHLQWEPRVPAQDLMNMLEGAVYITQGVVSGGVILHAGLYV